MPFDLTGAANTGSSPGTLRVAPEQVLRLKADLQVIYEEVNVFMQDSGQSMTMQPLGADAVSRETASTFNENAMAAVRAARGYLDALRGVLDALDQAARSYDLVEDTNTQSFRQALR